MSDDKTTDESVEAKPAAPAKAARKTAAPKTSDSDPNKEPTQASVEPARAEPAVVPATPNAAVSGAESDEIFYSRAVPAGKNGPRKSLTVQHVQRRLAEHGYPEGWSETRYGILTENSVRAYQESRGAAATGVLTRDQFTELFRGDPNVVVVVDTIGDHDGAVAPE